MKNNLLTAILILGLSSCIWSQKKGDVEFGLNIGLNNSAASDAETDFDPGYGYNLGGSMDYYFSTDWSIKAKLIYDQKGWNNDFIEDVNTGTVYPTDVNLNYLTVPVMAGWHFGNKRNWYLNFGLYMGVLLDAKETQFDSDISEYFNKNDMGLALGIGVKIPVSNKLKVFFEFDGQGGFNDVFENN
jgi:opacity protein-like surface antigen